MYNWQLMFISRPVPEVPMESRAIMVTPTDTSGQASITAAPVPPLYCELALIYRPNVASVRIRPLPVSPLTARCISSHKCTIRAGHNLY